MSNSHGVTADREYRAPSTVGSRHNALVHKGTVALDVRPLSCGMANHSQRISLAHSEATPHNRMDDMIVRINVRLGLDTQIRGTG